VGGQHLHFGYVINWGRIRCARIRANGGTWTPAAAPTALLATRDTATAFTLPPRDCYAALARRVGNPGIDRLRLTPGIEFVVGAHNPTSGTVNPFATTILTRYLEALADGNYPAPRHDRLRAQHLLASRPPQQLYGNCAITGLVNQRPCGLPQLFITWLTRWTSDVADDPVARVATEVAERVNAELAARGVPLHCQVVLDDTTKPPRRILTTQHPGPAAGPNRDGAPLSRALTPNSTVSAPRHVRPPPTSHPRGEGNNRS